MYYLKDLLEKITYEVVCGSDDVYVKSVENDSRKVSEKSLFICISGGVFDGHQFVDEVIEKGATVLVVEKDIPLPKKKEADYSASPLVHTNSIILLIQCNSRLAVRHTEVLHHNQDKALPSSQRFLLLSLRLRQNRSK